MVFFVFSKTVLKNMNQTVSKASVSNDHGRLLFSKHYIYNYFILFYYFFNKLMFILNFVN